jgi:hypothetical protein
LQVPPEGFVSYGEAAAVLGVEVHEIRGLVEHGLLRAAAGYRFGLSKLLPAGDVQRFAELYVATSALARRFHLNSRALARYMNESGTPLLAVPLSDRGRGHAFFLTKDVATQIQIPSRRMLQEHAQHRSVAARKQRWADYRQARETALGKPMRRIGVKHRQTL